MTIRSGKHARAINSDLYHSEIVDEEDEEEEEEGEMDYSQDDEDRQAKRRRHSSVSPERKKKGQRSPSEEGEQAGLFEFLVKNKMKKVTFVLESLSEQSDEQNSLEEGEQDEEDNEQKTHSNSGKSNSNLTCFFFLKYFV